jgi:Spy/CpxP family protein refolding chaperone
MRGHLNIQGIGRMVTLAGLIALSIANRNALAGPGGGQGRPGRILHRALASLDLTDAQKTKIQALVDQQKGDVQAFREQMKADRVALRTAVEATTPDPTVVGKAFLKVHADGQAAKAKLQALRSKLTPILTAEQNARLDGFLSAMRPMGGGMFGGPGQGQGQRRHGPEGEPGPLQ